MTDGPRALAYIETRPQQSLDRARAHRGFCFVRTCSESGREEAKTRIGMGCKPQTGFVAREGLQRRRALQGRIFRIRRQKP